MADQAVSEMISAFAAGCMDKENFVHFNNYLKNKGDMPYKELGQLQIVTSMLPVILEQEEPDAELKNRVARQLISMQDEIKEKIKLEKEKALEIERIKLEKEQAIEEAAEAQKQEQKEVFADTEVKNEPYIKQSELLQTNYMNFNNKLFPDRVTQPVEVPSQTPLWIAVVVLFVALIVVGLLAFLNISELNDTIAKTESNLLTAKNEWRSTNEFLSRNIALVEFFNHENVWIVKMEGIDPQMKISGKLFVAMDEKEALLQVNNLPTPTPENMYQLWLVTQTQTYSMGFFFVEPGSRYVKLINIPYIQKDQIVEFRISLEPRGGSVVPTGQAYASGVLEDAPAKPARK